MGLECVAVSGRALQTGHSECKGPVVAEYSTHSEGQCGWRDSTGELAASWAQTDEVGVL